MGILWNGKEHPHGAEPEVSKAATPGVGAWKVAEASSELDGQSCVRHNVCYRPILLKNSVPADGRRNLAPMGREARFDVEDHKEILITHPSVLSRF